MKYAAFLRGVNVGGRTSMKMERLREVAADLGLGGVRTYIQSGNLVFETERADEDALREELARAVAAEFFATPVMLRSFAALAATLAANPFAGEEFEEKLFHVVFLNEPLSPEKTALLVAHNSDSEKFAVSGRDVYCLLRAGVADSLLGKKFIDAKLKTPATARNLRTLRKILEM